MNPNTKKLEILFFVYPDSIILYKEYPNILLIDYTYKTNRFRIPLLNIGAVIGNKQHTYILFRNFQNGVI